MFRRSTYSLSNTSLDNFTKALKRYTEWYPMRGGLFLANMIAGHNAFIEYIPKAYDRKQARHFAFVEALTICPLFTLSMVHYFSIFCQYPSRVELLPQMMTELTQKAKDEAEWLTIMSQRKPTETIYWRFGMLGLQLILFPVWLLLSAIAPQLVHATVHHVNYIMYTKYECINNNAPPFVEQSATRCLQAQDFHLTQSKLPTDVGVAMIMLLIVLYIISEKLFQHYFRKTISEIL